MENVETVISEWIETAKAIGREIPVPKGKLMYAEKSSVFMESSVKTLDFYEINFFTIQWSAPQDSDLNRIHRYG